MEKKLENFLLPFCAYIMKTMQVNLIYFRSSKNLPRRNWSYKTESYIIMGPCSTEWYMRPILLLGFYLGFRKPPYNAAQLLILYSLYLIALKLFWLEPNFC